MDKRAVYITAYGIKEEEFYEELTIFFNALKAKYGGPFGANLVGISPPGAEQIEQLIEEANSKNNNRMVH